MSLSVSEPHGSSEAGSPNEILVWGMDYLNRFYDIMGAVNLEAGHPTAYRLGPGRQNL